MMRQRILLSLFGISSSVICIDASKGIWGSVPRGTRRIITNVPANVQRRAACSIGADVVVLLRGGADVDEEEYSEDEEAMDAIEYDSEADVEEEEYDEEEDAINVSADVEYDEQLVPSPMSSMYSVIGAMLIFRRLDMFDPKVVRLARIAFILYLVSIQVFAVYCKMRAKMANDLTPITIENPLAGIVKSQINNAMTGSSTSDTVKGLADKLLSNVSTVMEYDIKEANSLRNSVMLPMIVLWVLHFKMNQVQPLLMQIVTGVNNLVYHPLFQVYVMGRNLERPFKKPENPMAEKLKEAEAAAAAEAEATETTATGDEEDAEENANSEEEDEEEDESSDDASSSEDDDDSDDSTDEEDDE